jgi:hypothetical protein
MLKKERSHMIPEPRLHVRNSDLRYDATSPHNSFNVSKEHSAFSLTSRTSEYKHTMLLQNIRNPLSSDVASYPGRTVFNHSCPPTPAPPPPPKKKKNSIFN